MFAGYGNAGRMNLSEARIRQVPRVLARERNTVSHALVDDVDADFSQAVDVGFSRAEVAAFYGVVEQAIDAVAVVLIVLGGIDAALSSDRVRAAGAVLKTK